MYLHSTLPLATMIFLIFLTSPLTAEQINKTSRNALANHSRSIESRLQTDPRGANRKTRMDLVGGRAKQFPHDGYEFLKNEDIISISFFPSLFDSEESDSAPKLRESEVAAPTESPPIVSRPIVSPPKVSPPIVSPTIVSPPIVSPPIASTASKISAPIHNKTPTVAESSVGSKGAQTKQFPYDGYKYLKGLGVYRLYMERTNWAKAYYKCKDDDAHLAVINSEAEALALGTLFDKVPSCCDPTFNYAFIGFHDSFVSRKFLTADGNVPDNPGLSLEEAGYSEFAPGEPDNASTEKCGGMTRKGLLMDLACSVELFFICEKTFT